MMKKMKNLQQWLDDRLADIATKLPKLVLIDPASFSCGYNTGYKQCLLDLDRFIEEPIDE